ncbi:MAG: deoxyribonuclease IV [Thaumarchaeota archaeon]|nr:deoxyribonuclease IV [Candidatus Calditenuaceae archaeon]MCX8202795.1 deoxyribonuclease IV [Nitrososphaeria archaeon]MDW8043552.1 deoxyribonuclease IV [Nitrososphaerota archaeon]
MLLGAHVSIAGSIAKSVDRAQELGCTTFQIFTRNPRGWRAGKLRDEEVEEFRRRRREARYEVVVAHMPYLPNIASPVKEGWERSVRSLVEELRRCDALGIEYLVCHIGSHLGKGVEVGTSQVVRAVERAIGEADPKCVLLLENMAGQRGSIGSRFEEIKEILGRLSFGDRVGVCLDTCHLYAAGYDVRSATGLEETLRSFDELVGIRELKVLHLNDSKGGLGSRLDRHEHIGLGNIGKEGFRRIINHPKLRRLPMIIETPEDERGDYSRDLGVLRSLYEGPAG